MKISSVLNSEISDTQAAIRTYSNYSAAWCLWTQTDCTPYEAQSRLKAFSQLQPSSRYNHQSVRQHLLRGNLTLKLIQGIPIDERPDFAMISALWLSVQAYYAVHGFGMAFLSAKYGVNNLPKTHGAFMREAAERIVRHLFPSPFSAMLKNGYKGCKDAQPELINISDDRMFIESGFNIERPNEKTRDAHIAQCLNTTRQRLIESKLKQERKKAKKPEKIRGILKKQKKIDIAHSITSTTILDYLYRARIKSNYEDPIMYHEGSNDADAMLDLVRNTQKLTMMLCAFLVAILWQIIDTTDRDKFREDVDIECLLKIIDRKQ